MDLEKFKNLLDDNYNWPSEYTFKFIVSRAHEQQLIDQLDGVQWEKRESRTGKYSRFNIVKKMNSSDEVLSFYSKVKSVESLISL